MNSDQQPEAEMVDTPEQRMDRKIQAGDPQPRAEYRPPNRKTRRLIARRRGVFKHPGAWPYINQRSKQQDNGDQHNEKPNQS